MGSSEWYAANVMAFPSRCGRRQYHVATVSGSVETPELTYRLHLFDA